MVFVEAIDVYLVGFDWKYLRKRCVDRFNISWTEHKTITRSIFIVEI